MITPTDLLITYVAGIFAGLLIPVVSWGFRKMRELRARDIERRRWRAIAMFRG